ncbi:MAG: O-antigen ligase family protein [Pseudomonadota bacterium]
MDNNQGNRGLLGLLMAILCLYGIALVCSMAAMEILSWATFATLLYAFYIKKIDVETNYKHFLPALALFGWCALGALGKGFPPNRLEYAFGDFRWIVLLFSFTVAIEHLLKNKTLSHQRMIKIWQWTILCLLLFITLYSIVQYFYGIDIVRSTRMSTAIEENGRVVRWRPRGLFSMPLTFAYSLAMTLMCLFPSLAKLSSSERNPISILSLFVGLLGIIAILLSFTRGAWIAFGVGLGLILILRGSARTIIGAFSLAVVTVVVSISSSPFLRYRILSIFDSNHLSNLERTYIWTAYFQMFRDNPLFGVGYNIDGFQLAGYLEKMAVTIEYPGHAHNNYLQFLSTTGVGGFLLYLALIFYFLVLNFRLIKKLPRNSLFGRISVSLLAAQVVFHIGGMTECTFFDAELRHFLIFTWAWVLALTGYFKNGETTVAAA